MKIALFETSHGYKTVAEESAEAINGWIRISEYIDVDLPPLPDADVVIQKTKAIDFQINGLIEQINVLQGKKSELLALPCWSDADMAAQDFAAGLGPTRLSDEYIRDYGRLYEQSEKSSGAF